MVDDFVVRNKRFDGLVGAAMSDSSFDELHFNASQQVDRVQDVSVDYAVDPFLGVGVRFHAIRYEIPWKAKAFSPRVSREQALITNKYFGMICRLLK